ncbi:MAG: hypothetical protein ABW189_08595 [Rickettsiales bacterium]
MDATEFVRRRAPGNRLLLVVLLAAMALFFTVGFIRTGETLRKGTNARASDVE